MKIIVLHGEDSAKSYSRLSKFMDTAKSRGWEIFTDQFPNTPSLFGTERLIVYRDYKLLTKNEIKNFDKFDGTVVIYHDNEVPALFLKQLPKETKIEKFDMPKLLFAFLESIYPENSKRALTLLHEVIKTEAVELVMFMLSRQLRDLYWVKKDPSSTGFPPWKLNKLKSQANKFSESQLAQMLDNLSVIDIDTKTSKANLLTELDLMLVKQLK
jgi:hypothetical protein